MWNVDVEGADIQEQPRQFIKSEFQIYVLALVYSKTAYYNSTFSHFLLTKK